MLRQPTYVINPYRFYFKRASAIWSRITIHPITDGTLVSTFYYRILRGREGQLKDEAIFQTKPENLDYIYSHDPRHEKYQLHPTATTEKVLEAFSSRRSAHDGFSEAVESMLLHHHIYLHNPSANSLVELLNQFKNLEPRCASAGSYALGTYTFLTEEEEQAITHSYEQYLQSIKIKNSASTSELTPNKSSFLLQYKNANNIVLETINNFLKAKLGPAFLEDLGQIWELEKASAAHWNARFKISGITKEGQQWFLERFSGSTCQDLSDAVVQVNVPITASQIIRWIVDEHLTAKLGEKFIETYGKNWIFKEGEENPWIIELTIPRLSKSGENWFSKRFSQCQFDKIDPGKTLISIQIKTKDLERNHELTAKELILETMTNQEKSVAKSKKPYKRI